MKRLIFLVLISTQTYSCMTNKIQRTHIESIEFGSGGGFTGLYATYKVNLNDRSIQEEDKAPKKLRNQQMRILLKQLNKCDLFQIDFNRPYNFTYFIEVKGEENNKIIWGDPTFNPPEEITKLSDVLTGLTKEVDF